MAATWHAFTQAATYAANKHMLDVFNATAGSTTVRVYRAWLFNNQTAGVTGVLNFVSILRTSAASATPAVTPVPHNTSNTPLPAAVTAGTGRTITTGAQFRRLLMSPDEPSITTADWDALMCLVPFAEIWNSGYGDSVVDPVTCRTGPSLAEGFSIQSLTQTVGTADLEIEFTNT
jgi:hypothetical protein